jgi:hypothetical protein
MAIEYEYGINLVSMLHAGFRLWHPWWHPLPSGLFASPQRLIGEALEIGFDGVQAIPVWDLSGDEDGIILSQGPWNAVWSFSEARHHVPGTLKVRSELEDWVVSPNPTACEKVIDRMVERDIPRIYHSFDEVLNTTQRFIEIHPGLGMTPAQISLTCQERGLRLALDTKHLRRDVLQFETEKNPALLGKPSLLGENEQQWLKAIDEMAPLIDVIHVQPSEELEQFIADPVDTLTWRLARYALKRIERAGKAKKVILIAEYNPGKKRQLMPWACRNLATQMYRAMQRLVESVS